MKNSISMADKTFPSSTLFHYPILHLLSDGIVHTRKEMIALEIEMLSISEADLKEVTPGSKDNPGINKVSSWTGFAISDLKKAEYIIHSDKGYVITQEGMLFYEQHRNGFNANELQASKAYRKYKNKGEFAKPRGKVPVPPVASEPHIEPSPDGVDNTPSELSKSQEEGVVYILTNPAFKTFYIKIGYTLNIQERLKELYNTSVPLPFKVFALMKTRKYKQAEKMIHSSFKSSRIGDDREFFMMKPEEAFEQMKVVADGLDAVVILFDEKGNEKKVFDYSK